MEYVTMNKTITPNNVKRHFLLCEVIKVVDGNCTSNSRRELPAANLPNLINFPNCDIVPPKI